MGGGQKAYSGLGVASGAVVPCCLSDHQDWLHNLQCLVEMKMLGLLFKNYEEFQDRDS